MRIGDIIGLITGWALFAGWIGLGFWGYTMILKKGDPTPPPELKAAAWFLRLVGLILCILGPIALLIGFLQPQMKRCPHCKMLVLQSVTVCMYCKRDV